MHDNLASQREKIRKIDENILNQVKKRLLIAQDIASTKEKLGLPIVDLKIEKKVVDRFVMLGEELDLDKVFVKKLINILISEAVRIEGYNIPDRGSMLYDIFELTKELETQGEKVIRLEVGEPDFISPIQVKEAAAKALRIEGMVKYGSSQGLNELREAIVEELKREYQVDIDKSQVLITPGGKYSIFLGIMSSVSIGDRVVIPDPSWPVYHRCVEQRGGRVITLHTYIDEDWRLKIEDFEDVLDGAKMLILNNPCNPTGKIIPPKDVKKIAEIANEKGVIVISDEVYSAFTYSPFSSILEVLDSNFIYVDSFSKKFGMTGWRIGYAVSDTKTISNMQKIIQSSITCVPGFVQKAALEAIKSAKEIYLDYVKKVSKRIDAACKELDRLPLTYMRPDGAMYIFPRIDIEDINSKDFALKLLSEKKVALTPGEAFGDYPKHFRLSLTTDEKDIKKGIRSVGDMLIPGL